MPTYTFLNTETEEVIEKFMSMSSREEFLKDNPHIISIIAHAPAISGDSVGLGFRKNDAGFNDLMDRIGKANPGSAVAEKYTSKGINDAKVDAIVKKHKMRQNGGGS